MKGILLILLVLLLPAFPYSPLFAKGSGEGNITKRMERDCFAIQRSREGLANIISFMNLHGELFPKENPKDARFLDRSQRRTILRTWKAFLDHMVALDLLGQRYSALKKDKETTSKKRLFYVTYAIFLAQYRYALDFIKIAEGNPDLHTLLNEPVPEIGLPRGVYSDLKFEFLNVQKGVEFAWMDVLYRFYGDSEPGALARGIGEDRRLIWRPEEEEDRL
jgi:hypothetical protein